MVRDKNLLARCLALPPREVEPNLRSTEHHTLCLEKTLEILVEEFLARELRLLGERPQDAGDAIEERRRAPGPLRMLDIFAHVGKDSFERDPILEESQLRRFCFEVLLTLVGLLAQVTYGSLCARDSVTC